MDSKSGKIFFKSTFPTIGLPASTAARSGFKNSYNQEKKELNDRFKKSVFFFFQRKKENHIVIYNLRQSPLTNY